MKKLFIKILCIILIISCTQPIDKKDESKDKGLEDTINSRIVDKVDSNSKVMKCNIILESLMQPIPLEEKPNNFMPTIESKELKNDTMKIKFTFNAYRLRNHIKQTSVTVDTLFRLQTFRFRRN
jgi:hypothetical protein